MKIRHGFVTNSSSTSYVCQISGDVETGYNMTPDEAGMARCTNGHTFRLEYLLAVPKSDDIEELRALVLSLIPDRDRDYIREDRELATHTDSRSELDKLLLFYTEEGYYVIPHRCPICQLKHITGSMLARYLLSKTETDRGSVVSEIRSQFNTLSELENAL